jgi:hypothetical protein
MAAEKISVIDEPDACILKVNAKIKTFPPRELKAVTFGWNDTQLAISFNLMAKILPSNRHREFVLSNSWESLDFDPLRETANPFINGQWYFVGVKK